MNYQSTCHNSIFYVVTEDGGGRNQKKALCDEDSPCLFCAPYSICIDK